MPEQSEVLMAKISAYYAAREAYEIEKKLSDEAHKVWRGKEADLVDFMLEQGVKKISLDDGTTPMLVKSTSISVTQENYESIRQWLRDTVGDDTDFVVTIPHKPTVLAHVKKLMEEDLIDPSEMPEFLKCDTRPTLRVDGWKGR